MKRILKTNAFVRPLGIALALSFLVFSSTAVVFSAEDAKSVPSTTPSPKDSTKTNSRSLPIQDFYDTSSPKVEAVADSLEYQKDSGKLIARGNAVITYQGTKILADYAEVETDAKKAYAKGHVMIFRKDAPRLQGEEIYYDFGNHTGSFPDARAINAPFYAHGKDIQQVNDRVSNIQSGSITTCNLDKPHYEIRCKKATLYADEKLVMRNATIYVLGKPIFWLPWMEVPLNWQVPFQAKVGHSSEYGYYLELSKGITFNQYLAGKAHIDWRSERGFGAGWDQYYDFGKYAHGNVKLYLTQDKKAPTISGEANPYAKREDRERGRITWRHRTDINDDTHVILRYHRAADQYFLQDFFEEEFRAEQQPTSFVTGTHNTERYGLLAHGTMKMNSYESMVERLPEVRLDWKNQPFYKELVHNESRVQFDNLTKTYGHTSEKQKAVRTDAYSRWYMPLKWKDVNVMPFAGYRGTEYSQLRLSDASSYRSVIEYGTDLRTHFYRIFDVSFDKMGIEVNQLRHVFVPSVTFQGTQSTLSNQKITHFDTVDFLDNSAELVFGLENRLQTKRVINGRTQRVDFVSLNTYLHFEANPKDSPGDGTGFTAFENDLTLRPYEWLQFQTRVKYDYSGNFLQFANNDMLIRKGPWKFVFGYRYQHEYLDKYEEQWIEGSSELLFETRYQLNHLWEVGGYIRYDTATTGIQEYQVSATRDLHDFILEFGYNVRNSWIDENNNELFFNFRMKGMPSLQVGAGGGRATFAEPRIGETVAGANAGAGMFQTATLADQTPLLSTQS